MRKVRIDKQLKKNKSGFLYLVKWTEIDASKTGKARYKERAKCVHTMTEARQYQHKKYQELNSDVYYDCLKVTLDTARSEFERHCKARGLTEAAQYKNKHSLDMLKDKVYLPELAKISEKHIQSYIISRQEDKASVWTINSELSCLRTFFNWAKKQQFHKGIEIDRLKCPQIHFRCPDTDSIRKLFIACPGPAWTVRLLISLCTGLRAGDVDRLNKADIDLKHKAVTTTSRKTQKVFPDRPLPDTAMPTIEAYVKSLPAEQVRLFSDGSVRYTWEKIIRIKAGLQELTRQDLRKTFSTLLQKVGSFSSAKQLLEHSSDSVTQQFYTDNDLILRWKINRLPVAEWLKGKEK